MRPSITNASTTEQLVLRCRVGRADALQPPRTQATGLASLDAVLSGGGLPIGAVTEILSKHTGIGELRLLMPILQHVAQQRYVALIDPPHLPYAPALIQHGVDLERLLIIRPLSPALALWASEQTLRCTAVGIVLLWLNTINDKEIRRLQLSAEAGSNLAILYRSTAFSQSASPAAVRLILHSSHQNNPHQNLRIEIKKCRGGHAGQIVAGNQVVESSAHRFV
jgi:hypothetical protein